MQDTNNDDIVYEKKRKFNTLSSPCVTNILIRKEYDLCQATHFTKLAEDIKTNEEVIFAGNVIWLWGGLLGNFICAGIKELKPSTNEGACNNIAGVIVNSAAFGTIVPQLINNIELKEDLDQAKNSQCCNYNYDLTSSPFRGRSSTEITMQCVDILSTPASSYRSTDLLENLMSNGILGTFGWIWQGNIVGLCKENKGCIFGITILTDILISICSGLISKMTLAHFRSKNRLKFIDFKNLSWLTLIAPEVVLAQIN